MPLTLHDEDQIEEIGLKYRLMTFIVAIAYAGVLASLPLESFKDRGSYLDYAANSWSLLNHYWCQNPLVALSNEPIWLLINSFLAILLPAETTLRVLIFIPAFVVAWIVLQQNPRQFVWLLLILFYPAVIKNHIIHLRQGVAIAVFLMGWITEGKPLRWMLIGITPFIHASFFFVLGLLGLSRLVLKMRLGPDVRMLLFAASAIIISLVIKWLSALVGARQSQSYQFTMGDVSGLGFILWASVLIVLCMQGRTYMRSHTLEIGAIIFYLTTYFFIEISARIFESVLILVLLAGLQLTGWRRTTFLVLIIISAVLRYASRLDEPWLGWGV